MKLLKGLRQLLYFLKLWHLTYQLDAHLRVGGGLQFSLNFPAGSLPNLTVSHHLEVNGNSATSKTSMQGWRTLSCPPHIHWYHFYTLGQHLYLPRDRIPVSCVEGGDDDHPVIAVNTLP